MRLRVVTHLDDGAIPEHHIGIIVEGGTVALFKMDNEFGSLAYSGFMQAMVKTGHSLWHNGVCIIGTVAQLAGIDQ